MSRAILWFRQDLRIDDNLAWNQAMNHDEVMLVYIHDTVNSQDRLMGKASQVWLHHSLTALDASCENQLNVFQGDAERILSELIRHYDVDALYWNRCYEPWQIGRDARIKKALSEQVQIESHNGSLLWEPWEVKKADGTPYKVFTPFYRKGCLSRPVRHPVQAAQLKVCFKSEQALNVTDLRLLPQSSWDQKILSSWSPGEVGAQNACDLFLNQRLSHYRLGRDMPSLKAVSRLSPHLHFGEISVNRIWHQVQSLPQDDNTDHFQSELGWREFSYSQLFYQPHMDKKNIQVKFDRFPWQNNQLVLAAWQKGQTGIPIVDAGMRELWQTGYMHNRVRMIVGSFLVKNLQIDWRLGERWFWDTLLDADMASNCASWQWVAGCGADAAPYFRIFNPVLQGQRFDSKGAYTRKFVPELVSLPDKYLFSPWLAPEEVLISAGIQLGINYPKPIVDLKGSRQLALDAYANIK
ncbi:DNA photolyase family protein [Gammaproteobacteria bacterium]|nr:DNA photolyase family protein [Gammaproteobacteria bacterium]